MKPTGSFKSSILFTVFLIAASIIPSCESMKEDPAHVATGEYKDNIKLFRQTIVAESEADENYLRLVRDTNGDGVTEDN